MHEATSKSLSLNRRGRSERVPRLKIHRARKPVSSCVRGRRKYQVPPHAPFLSAIIFFPLFLPLMMSLVMPFDESISITVESRCEGRREKMKAARSRLNYRKRHAAYVLRSRKSRSGLRKEIRVYILRFYNMSGLA